MATTNYTTVGNTLIAQRSAGGARMNYGQDAIGSVAGTIVAGSLVNTYYYKPYGATLAKTGPGIDPNFQWIGCKGYRVSNRNFAESYIRARHYQQGPGRWTSIDPLWPDEHAFAYAGGQPTRYTDPSGMKWGMSTCGTPPAGWQFIFGSVIETYDVLYSGPIVSTQKLPLKFIGNGKLTIDVDAWKLVSAKGEFTLGVEYTCEVLRSRMFPSQVMKCIWNWTKSGWVLASQEKCRAWTYTDELNCSYVRPETSPDNVGSGGMTCPWKAFKGTLPPPITGKI